MSRRARSGGFTLVEALVAVTLLALMLGALMPVFQQGLAILERGDRRTRAVILAQGLLELHAAPQGRNTAPELETSGTDGDFRWEVSREPYDLDDGGPPVDPQRFENMALVRVTAHVRWEGGGDGLALSTLSLEREP